MESPKIDPRIRYANSRLIGIQDVVVKKPDKTEDINELLVVEKRYGDGRHEIVQVNRLGAFFGLLFPGDVIIKINRAFIGTRHSSEHVSGMLMGANNATLVIDRPSDYTVNVPLREPGVTYPFEFDAKTRMVTHSNKRQ